MIPSQEAIEEFKKIYKKEFGEELSDQDATERATKLLNLMEAIYRPIPKRDYDKIQETKN